MYQIFDLLFEQYSQYQTKDIVLEIVAVVFGLLSVWCSKNNNILVFPTGMISTAIFIYLLYKWVLLGDMMINAYYFLMSIYGWFIWTRKENNSVTPISRVTNSKIILTEWGAMSLKSFFSSSIANSDKSTEMHAASAVRETIKKLISSEITSKPLSDDKLADILGKDGMDIARRTVAKYRDMLKIPSSAQRRRSARLQSISN